MDTINPRMTRHAEQRLHQRSAGHDATALVYSFGDREIRTRNGCSRLELSRVAAATLIADGYARPLVTKACRIRLIIDGYARVVTVIRTGTPSAVRTYVQADTQSYGASNDE